MPNVPQSAPGLAAARKRAVVATAALPVVMLSALALAQPAAAATPHVAPAKPSYGHVPGAGTAAQRLAAVPSVRAAEVAILLPAGTVTAIVPSHAAAPSSYTIVAGDTVSSIAGRYGLNVSDVLKLNNLGPASLIYPGKTLALSGAAAPAPAPQAAAASTAPAPSAGSSYTIKAGDTLTSIAAAHQVKVADLMAANNLRATTTIYAGKPLTIPGTVTVASSQAPVPVVVANDFPGYTYPEAVVAQANVNKAALMAAPVPSPAAMKQLIASTASAMGVDPALAQAFALQESGFDQQAVSPANAIGAMQVIPSSGEWASDLVGRHLNLLDPHDNVTAGLAIIRALVASSGSEEDAIAGYYQGQTSVAQHGMFDDTKAYVAAITANKALFG